MQAKVEEDIKGKSRRAYQSWPPRIADRCWRAVVHLGGGSYTSPLIRSGY